MTEQKKFPKLKQAQAGKKSSRKLLVILLTFFVALLVILFFKSTITEINEIQISGNEYVTDLQIGQASQINVGDHFFSVSSNTLERRLKQIKSIKSVKVSKKFPGELSIQIHEYKAVAMQISTEGLKTVLLANGTKIPLNGKGALVNKPILTGWTDENTWTIELCKVLGEIPADMLADISEIKPDPTAVYPDKMKMYTRSQFEVTTTIGYLPEKIEYMRAIIAEEEPGFLTMLEANYRAPYEKDAPAEIIE
ncbi:MAG TPA: FtsQ-type POTRA domain-containing protein [Bacilli bacterium]